MKIQKEAGLLILGLGLSFQAAAAPAFYGAIDGGIASAHNTLPWVTNDTTLQNRATDFGDGESFGLNVGVKLDGPLFLELGFNQATTENDDSVGALVAGGGDCDVAPLLGLIDDCWDRGEISIEVERQNFDFIAGWTLKMGSFEVAPYAGLRKQTVEDSRRVDYLYDGGVSNFITQSVDVDGMGLVLGARVEQDIGQFFWGGDVQYAHMDADRDLAIDDREVATPGGNLTDRAIAMLSDNVTSNQYGLKVYGGMKFQLAGQDAKVSLGYSYQESTNLLVTSNTSPDTYVPGTVGDSSGDLRLDTLFLSLGIALK